MILASKEKSDFPIKKVWVLPSHLIILIRNGGREDLLAYDQVPKLVSSDNEKVTLSHHGSYSNLVFSIIPFITFFSNLSCC